MAMVNQLAIVDREALHLAIVHHSTTTSVLVESNASRRFLSQMIVVGLIKKKSLQYNQGILTVLLDPNIEYDGSKTLEFATGRAKCRLAGEKRKVRDLKKAIGKPYIKCKRITEPGSCDNQRDGQILVRQTCTTFGDIKQQSQEKIAEVNLNFHIVLETLGLSSIPVQASILSGTVVVPCARHMIKVLIDQDPIGLELGSSTAVLCTLHFESKRSCVAQLLGCSWSLATSCLFREELVKISEKSFTSSDVVIRENILWRCDLLILRFFGIHFVAAAELVQKRAVPELKGPHFTVETSTGMHNAHLFAIYQSSRTTVACPAMSGPWQAWSCKTDHDEEPMPGHAQNVNRLFQVVTSYCELWRTRKNPRCLAFKCVTFMHCLFRAGTSVGVIVMDRLSDRCKPDFDYLETTALILDLWKRGTLRAERPALTEPCRAPKPKRLALTIFDLEHAKECTSQSVVFGKTAPIRYAMFALQRHVSIRTPVFFASHCAFDRVLA